jgi:hypothetical protein
MMLMMKAVERDFRSVYSASADVPGQHIRAPILDNNYHYHTKF